MKKRQGMIGVLAALLTACVAVAQEEPSSKQDLTKLFERREAMIAMRDGVKLHAEIYTPRDTRGPLPMLMLRTPYGVSAGGHAYSRFLKADQHFYADGYIFGLCLPGHTREVWLGRQFRDEPAGARPERSEWSG